MPGIRMGPGPIDLFSTRFNNTFPENVQATVAGTSVNREQLKDRLLGLQKHYKPDSTQFVPSDDLVVCDLLLKICTTFLPFKPVLI